MAEDPEGAIGIPIRWGDPAEAPAVYPTNLVVQYTPEEFILHFYAVDPPFLFGTNEEKAAQAKQLTSIPAKPLVRVILSPGRLREFLKLLNDNVTVFEQKRAKAAASEVEK